MTTQLLPASLLTFCALICLVILLSGLRAVLTFAFPKQQRAKVLFWRTTVLLVAWILLLTGLSLSGFFADFSRLPPRLALALLGPLPVVLGVAFSKTGRRLLSYIPPHWAIYLQSFRIFVEIALWLAVSDKLLPVQMSFEGRNFDMLSGLLAFPVGYYCFVKKSWPKGIALLYNIVGLILLANIVSVAVLSAPAPFRVFHNEPDSSLIAHFPFIFLPGLLVPLAYSLHIFSICQWFQTRSKKNHLRQAALMIPCLTLLQISAFPQYHTDIPRYHTDKKLETRLHALSDTFHGVAGIYVLNLRTGKEAAVNADSVFPTASIIKVPILVGIFDKINQGVLKYHQPLIYRDSMARKGSGLMQFFKDSSATDVRTAITLMITHSDNAAAVWCERLAGGGPAINSWLEGHGFRDTRVNARTPGRDTFRQLYGWGQTTPREMARLATMIRNNEAISPAASQTMYRIMTHVFWDEYALSRIPPYVQVASKQGMVDDSRSEIVLVNAPHGDYVFYVATKNNKDQRWVPENEAWQLARNVSALLWENFEPHSEWRPAADAASYWY